MYVFDVHRPFQSSSRVAMKLSEPESPLTWSLWKIASVETFPSMPQCLELALAFALVDWHRVNSPDSLTCRECRSQRRSSPGHASIESGHGSISRVCGHNRTYGKMQGIMLSPTLTQYRPHTAACNVHASRRFISHRLLDVCIDEGPHSGIARSLLFVDDLFGPFGIEHGE